MAKRGAQSLHAFIMREAASVGGLKTTMPDGARWERGHRVHGLWRGTTRIASVSLTPCLPGRRTQYIWRAAGRSGTLLTLEAAKKAAQRALTADPA